MEKIELPKELVQNILNYLANHPWGQVNQLIVELSKYWPQANQPKAEEPKDGQTKN